MTGLAGRAPLLSYLVLLRVGFTLPPISLSGRCALTLGCRRKARTFSPLPALRVAEATGRDGGMFSVALSVSQAYGPLGGHPPATLAVSEHTALRSSDFPLPRLRAGDPIRTGRQKRRGSDHPACPRKPHHRASRVLLQGEHILYYNRTDLLEVGPTRGRVCAAYDANQGRGEAIRERIDPPRSLLPSIQISRSKTLKGFSLGSCLPGYLATNRKKEVFTGFPVLLSEQSTKTAEFRPARSAVVQDTLLDASGRQGINLKPAAPSIVCLRIRVEGHLVCPRAEKAGVASVAGKTVRHSAIAVNGGGGEYYAPGCRMTIQPQESHRH